MCSVCPQRAYAQETAPACGGLGAGTLTAFPKAENRNFPSPMRGRCEPGAAGTLSQGRCPLWPFGCSWRRDSRLYSSVCSAIALELPHTHTRTHLRPRSHTLTHARERVAAARSATSPGAPRGAGLPPVVVGRRPRLPAVLSNGPGSRIGPAAGTTPARLLHSSDTRASRDI